MRRLTRYRYNNIPVEDGGRYFSINDGGDVWSPSYRPYKKDLDHFETRHGMGYTRITGERGGLEASVLLFVPVDINAEIHQVTLTNKSTRPRMYICAASSSSACGTPRSTRPTTSAT